MAEAFTGSEKAITALRGLYSGYGYTQFKMSKFEEYDLYVKNKDFLISDQVLTFTDLNGKLMALKPDVTLSIVKSLGAWQGGVKKLYYHENVYRPGSGTRSFRELMQVGLECLGDVGEYEISEVLLLAKFKDADIIALPVERVLKMALYEFNLLRDSWLGQQFACLQIMFCLAENPRIADGRAAYHYGIDTVTVKHLGRLLRAIDIAIADDRDVKARIRLGCPNQRPVGLALVHLATCAPVNGNGLYSHILQPLGQFHYGLVGFIPAQTRLDRDGQLDGIDDTARYLNHKRNVLQQTGSGAFTCHSFYRASEINVDQVGFCLLYTQGGLNHSVRVLAVDLDSDGALAI